MSNMEPDVRNFLARIANSLAIGLLWMLINTTLGIGLNLAFFENKPSVGNYIFYVWFLTSLVALLFYYKKKWKL